VAERSIRDFQAPYAVAPIADAWAGANGFALSLVEADGSRHYVRGSGLLTGQMMCVVRQFGTQVRIEAYIHARLAARISALFLIPEEKSVEPGGFMGALPRKICRDAVDKLLGQLGQPPITSADNTGRTAGVRPASAGAIFVPAAIRPPSIAFLALVEAVNAVVCLTVVRDFWWGFNYRATYDEMNWAAVDLVMALTYLALAAGSAAVAWRLWSMRRDAWLAAVQLSAAMLAATVVSGVIWGFDGLGVVGIVVHVSVIWYLYTASVQALFGRRAQS